MMLIMVTSPIESFFHAFPRSFGGLQIRLAANWLPDAFTTGSLHARGQSSQEAFEAGARTARREAVDRGTAAAEQATRQAEQSYASIADGIREFNTKLLDIAQANTMAGMNFVSKSMR